MEAEMDEPVVRVRRGAGTASVAAAETSSTTGAETSSTTGAGTSTTTGAGTTGSGAGTSSSAGTTSRSSTGAGTTSASAMRSRLLLPTFHDGESIRSYTLSFVMEAEACNLPKPQWRSKYFSLLAGSAKTVAYMFLIQNPVCTFEDLKLHLENQLERSQDRTARLALWSINRRENEDLLEFASRVRASTLAAYGTEYTANQIDDKALDCFTRALRGELGKRTREMFPRTLDESVSLARNFETLGISDQDTGETIAAVSYQNRNRQEKKKPEKKDFTCWYCQKTGHKKQDCWTLHPEKAPKGKKRKEEGKRDTEEN